MGCSCQIQQILLRQVVQHPFKLRPALELNFWSGRSLPETVPHAFLLSQIVRHPFQAEPDLQLSPGLQDDLVFKMSLKDKPYNTWQSA